MFKYGVNNNKGEKYIIWPEHPFVNDMFTLILGVKVS